MTDKVVTSNNEDPFWNEDFSSEEVSAPDPPVYLLDFVEDYGIALDITFNEEEAEKPFVAYCENLDTDGGSTFVRGQGRTPNDALVDLAEKLSHQKVRIDPEVSSCNEAQTHEIFYTTTAKRKSKTWKAYFKERINKLDSRAKLHELLTLSAVEVDPIRNKDPRETLRRRWQIKYLMELIEERLRET